MKKGVDWYKHSQGDFLIGTRSLTNEQCGAYIRLLDLIYDNRGPIPDNETALASTCNCQVRVWRRLRQQLIDLGKLKSEGGYLSNGRAEREIAAVPLPQRKMKSLDFPPANPENIQNFSDSEAENPGESRKFRRESQSKKKKKKDSKGLSSSSARARRSLTPDGARSAHAKNAAKGAEKIAPEEARRRLAEFNRKVAGEKAHGKKP